MNTEELQVVAFEIILHSGTARATVHEAFAAMRLGHYDEASQKLLQDYASGVEIKIEIIMVHAQDHLMTTMTLREVALEMLELYKKLEEK